MRTVPTSNGLEWDTDGSAYLDAIPLVPRADLPITLRMVLAAMTHMDWLDWAAWMKGAQHPALKGYVGVVGVAARHRDQQITERVRLCRDYVAQHYLPGDDVEVRQVRGPWWPITPKRVEVVDHGAQEIVPVAVIEQTFMPPAVRR